tara:strand:- start:13954 stop:14511 length:558 start_codon:yes stop_codon:yes gene_type:complete
MTDLNLAYGFLDETQIDNNNFMNQMQINQMDNMENNIQNDNKIQENNINVDKKKRKKKPMNMDLDERPLLQRQQESYKMQNTDNIPEYPYAKKFQPVQQQQIQSQQQSFEIENTFWNRFTSKKGEVFKLIMFSFVILFAISIDKIGTYYITKYVNENVLTDRQEFIIRLAYPVIIILLLWIFKAL